MVCDVLKLGDPRLRTVCEKVHFPMDEIQKKQSEDLMDTLEDFRKKMGFGRGIAAPQIGVGLRMIALNLGEGPIVICNPEIIWHAEETFDMWDDCMSFPDLLVKVRRYQTIDIQYQDLSGNLHVWMHLNREKSELLQHEMDHLDGVLAIDRMLDTRALVYKDEFECNRSFYEGKSNDGKGAN